MTKKGGEVRIAGASQPVRRLPQPKTHRSTLNDRTGNIGVYFKIRCARRGQKYKNRFKKLDIEATSFGIRGIVFKTHRSR